MAPVLLDKAGNRPRTRSQVAAAERFRPSLRYLLSAWHLNQRVENSPFSFLQEQELCKMAYGRTQSGSQLSQAAFCILVYRFAARLNRASTGHLHAWRNSGGRAGKKWLKSFLTRYPEMRTVLRNPRAESVPLGDALSPATPPGPAEPSLKHRNSVDSAQFERDDDDSKLDRLYPTGKKFVMISYPTNVEANDAHQQRDRVDKQRNTHVLR